MASSIKVLIRLTGTGENLRQAVQLFPFTHEVVREWATTDLAFVKHTGHRSEDSHAKKAGLLTLEIGSGRLHHSLVVILDAQVRTATHRFRSANLVDGAARRNTAL